MFPANRARSERLNGMPESIPRRHLARLVQLGVVNRHGSPNSKRYARRVGQGLELASGFDLSPLNGHTDQISLTAERMRTLHDRIALARQQLIALNDSRFAALIENARLILRRKPSEQALQDLTREIADTADQNTGQAVLQPVLQTVQLSGPDSQNERHIFRHTNAEGLGKQGEIGELSAGNLENTVKPMIYPTMEEGKLMELQLQALLWPI